MDSIEYELNFLNLLNYDILEISKNHWQIIDDKNTVVGHLKVNEISGYDVCHKSIETYINSDTIVYENTRIDGYPLTKYYFFVKNGDQTISVLLFPDSPRFHLWNNSVQLRVNDEFLLLSMKSENGKYNMTERVRVNRNLNHDYNLKSYAYEIVYYSKENDPFDDTKNHTITKSVEVVELPTEGDDPNIKLTAKTWIDRSMIIGNAEYHKDSFENVLMENHLGIGAARLFRKYINSLLPFNQDILSILFSDEDKLKYGNPEYYGTSLELFFPDVFGKSVVNSSEYTKKYTRH